MLDVHVHSVIACMYCMYNWCILNHDECIVCISYIHHGSECIVCVTDTYKTFIMVQNASFWTMMNFDQNLAVYAYSLTHAHMFTHMHICTCMYIRTACTCRHITPLQETRMGPKVVFICWIYIYIYMYIYIFDDCDHTYL